jgi:SAM-dependent methyltransferase
MASSTRPRTAALSEPPAPGTAIYDSLAPVYDLLTAGYDHGRWLGALERLALEHGLAGRRLLDVACGTGSSFLPLLLAGYEVTACDVSPAMAARAAQRANGRAAVRVADMRSLPRWGQFDLVTCLDDSINHLTDPLDVVAALRGMRANLAPDGLLIFDVNAFAAYRAPGDHVVTDGDRLVAWRGGPATLEAPGGIVEVVVEAFERVEGELWRHSSARQPHRHYPLAQIGELVDRAGLRLVATRGQRPGAVLDPVPDEQVHTKVVVLASRDCRDLTANRREGA